MTARTDDKTAGRAAGPTAMAGEPDAGPAAGATPSFSLAMQELESILERIDGDEIDIDQLAGELQRATELLELCRGKIRKAEVEVHQIVQQLEDASGS